MKKTAYLFVVILFMASCSSGDKNEQLKELKKERNNLKTELNNINQQISKIEDKILGNGGELPARNQTFVKTSVMQTETFRHYINVQGDISSDNNIMVPVESPGVVKTIYVEEGDDVKKGQKLARIDASVIEKQITELKTNLDFARDVFERRKRLWEKEIGSEIEYLQAKNTKETLEKKLATVNEQLSKTTIKAPLSGTVDEVFLKEGEMAPAGFAAARVVQLSKMKIKAEVSESYLNQIAKGNEVIVSPVNSNEKYISKVITVGKIINPDNRTFLVEVALPEAKSLSTPNMIMELKILNYINENAITVPVNVVQKTQNKHFLFMAKQSGDKWVSEKRWIKTGMTFKNKMEITDGLKQGEYVITSGYQGLGDEEPIVIKN